MKQFLFNIKEVIEQWQDGLIPDTEAVVKIFHQMLILIDNLLKGTLS